MMTCVSERSGIASSGMWRRANTPPNTTAAVAASTSTLFFSEKSMIRASMAKLGRALFDFVAALEHGRAVKRVLEFGRALQPPAGADAGSHRTLEDVEALRPLHVVFPHEVDDRGAEIGE